MNPSWRKSKGRAVREDLRLGFEAPLEVPLADGVTNSGNTFPQLKKKKSLIMEQNFTRYYLHAIFIILYYTFYKWESEVLCLHMTHD